MRFLLTALAIGFCCDSARAQSCHESGPEPHGMPPVGVMNGHMHSKGHIMAEYYYMVMDMNGLMINGNTVKSDALSLYTEVPTTMRMNMHMMGVMVGVTNDVTVMVMANYMHSTMEMIHRIAATAGGHVHNLGSTTQTTGGESTMLMSSRAWADTQLSAQYRITKDPNKCLHAIGTLIAPTGNYTLLGEDGRRMNYGMQTGTGSWQLAGGLNYSHLMNKQLIGAQFIGTTPLNTNGIHYKVGHNLRGSAWFAQKINRYLSVSARAQGIYQAPITGSDFTLNELASPTNAATSTEWARLNSFIGLNSRISKWMRLGVEAGVPLYQWSPALTMKTSWEVTGGIQFTLN